MHAYVDHNFLLNCMKNAEWRKLLIEVHESAAVRIVLSPYHLYEIGNARKYDDTEDLVKFVEQLQPDWSMSRADLQLFEFWATWRWLWEASNEVVNPIGTFSEIAAVLIKVHFHRVVHATVRDFADTFSVEGALDPIRLGMDEQRDVAGATMKAYMQDRFTKNTRLLMDKNHLALQLARTEVGDRDPERTFARAREIMMRQPVTTQMGVFVDWGYMRYLKCHETEATFSDDLYFNAGVLSRNRLVDREHASVALPQDGNVGCSRS